jgi:hypothetical protein
MVRLHTGIIVFCFLSAFASSVLAKSPNDEAVFRTFRTPLEPLDSILVIF